MKGSEIPRRRRVRHSGGALWIVGLLLLSAVAVTARAGERETIRGKLEAQPGGAEAAEQPLTFVTAGGERLTVWGDEFSEGQLKDPRLAGRVWDLEGLRGADGRFEIRNLFTIRDGKRHRVLYYCEVCNIHTHSPGRCMCCQDETVLQEHPEDEEVSN